MSSSLFIDPLPRDFTSDDLVVLLRQFGEVVSAKIACDSMGYSLRFGHAEMQTEEQAENVVKQLHGKVMHYAPLTVLRTDHCAAKLSDQLPFEAIYLESE